MTRRRLFAALVGLSVSVSVACETGPRPTQEPETALVGTPPEQKERPQAAPDVEPDEPPPEDVRLELVMLELGNPYETDTGVVVELTSEKPIKVALRRRDQVVMVGVDANQNYSEGRAFGSTWAITTEGALHLELRHDPDEPLTPERARQVALRELDSNLGCEGELRQLDAPSGTVRFVRVDDDDSVICSVVVGVHTGQVLGL